MDITDIFPIDQIEELRKYGLLNETHYIRYVIGREFSLLLAEGKTYHEVSVILGDKIWNFFGEKRCFDEGSIKNIFIWYTKQVKNLGTNNVTSEVNKYKELK